jgi:hypothetical protein
VFVATHGTRTCGNDWDGRRRFGRCLFGGMSMVGKNDS